MVLLYPYVSAGARQNVWLSSEAACSSGSGQLNTRALNSRPGKERFSPLIAPLSVLSVKISGERGRDLFFHTHLCLRRRTTALRCARSERTEDDLMGAPSPTCVKIFALVSPCGQILTKLTISRALEQVPGTDL
jgi:hypothetical protein